jgi:putative endonuclease
MEGSDDLIKEVFYFVYILRSIKNDGLYVGLTNNLPRRFSEHNRKKSFSTKSYAPWQLIFYEAYLNKDDAERRERYLKTNQGARVVKRMLKEYFYKKEKRGI